MGDFALFRLQAIVLGEVHDELPGQRLQLAQAFVHDDAAMAVDDDGQHIGE